MTVPPEETPTGAAARGRRSRPGVADRATDGGGASARTGPTLAAGDARLVDLITVTDASPGFSGQRVDGHAGFLRHCPGHLRIAVTVVAGEG